MVEVAIPPYPTTQRLLAIMLFLRAEKAAKSECSKWIRASLHTLFLQALQEMLSRKNREELGRSQHDVTSHNQFNQIALSAQDIDLCVEYVGRVTRLWIQKLQANHDRVAQW